MKIKQNKKIIIELNSKEAEILMGILDHGKITDCHPKLYRMFEKLNDLLVDTNNDVFNQLDKKLK